MPFFVDGRGVVFVLLLLALIIGMLLRYRYLYLRMQKSEAKTRFLLEKAVDAVVMIDEHGILQSFNSAAEKLYGWSAKEVVGQSVGMLMPASYRTGENSYLAMHLATGWAGAMGHGSEVDALTKDGRLVPARLVVRRLRQENETSYVGFLTDLTEIKKSQDDYDEMMRTINRTMVMVEYRLDGCVLTANQNFLELLGYTFAEVRGQHHQIFCSPETIADPAYSAQWTRILQGETYVGEYQRIGKDGQRVWVQGSYKPVFDSQGQPVKVIEFGIDTTQRKLADELREGKERAELLAEARTNFLSVMSHEIRTPMNAIVGFTDVLLRTKLDAEQRKQLLAVQHAGRSLMGLINDILDSAKLERGAVALDEDLFSLSDLCELVLDLLRVAAAQKQLRLLLDYPSTLPEYFYGDAFRIQQVLLNLVSNAVKFTEAGHVLLRVRYMQGVLALSVEDTGIGIAPDKLEHIFSPFSQADASTSRKFGGTGLGTTISRQLVELMRGEISVRSTLGKGSVFTVKLPLLQGEKPQVDEQPTISLAQRLPRLRVLAVDDVPSNLELVRVALERDGHSVVFADTGEEAVYLSQIERFDLLLLDLHMPGLDGVQCAQKIRAYEKNNDLWPVPIVALSASIFEEDQKNALAAGMNGFAYKPLDLPKLYIEIARVLGLKVDNAMEASSTVTTEHQQGAGSTSIDWQQGERRWGGHVAFESALLRFVNEHREMLAQGEALLSASDHDGLIKWAHRLRGGAGNLAMLQVMQALSAVEMAAKQMDLAAEEQALAALAPAWQKVLSVLPESEDVQLREDVFQEDMLLSEEGMVLLNKLTHALAQGEFPEATVVALQQYLPKDALLPLQKALDRFDFDDALNHAHLLQSTYQGHAV